MKLCRLSEATTLHVSIAQGFTPLPKGCRPFGTSGVSAIALYMINPPTCLPANTNNICSTGCEGAGLLLLHFLLRFLLRFGVPFCVLFSVLSATFSATFTAPPFLINSIIIHCLPISYSATFSVLTYVLERLC